jgi:hypothetical protein
VHLVVLNLKQVRMGVNQPRLTIRWIASVVYWEESLSCTVGCSSHAGYILLAAC